MNRQKIKMLIELANSFEEADCVVTEYSGLQNYAEKVAYLKGMFDCEIVGKMGEDYETDYIALLTAIVNEKWGR